MDQSKKSSGELYGEDYYCGRSSGYPSEGYQALRNNWHGWLELITQIKAPPGVFVDLGSAYGYLVSTARTAGYQAFGGDISSYALQQEPEIRPFLTRFDVQRLPIASRSADVVALFDVLEHLENPESCLAEASRILKPSGLILGTTPDPIFFDREEETHCFERPPSFWLDQLRKLGLVAQFRFSEDPFNFQFLAAWPDSDTANAIRLLQHDFFSDNPEFITLESSAPAARLVAVPRSGWGSLINGSRTLKNRHASIYLLNSGADPIRSNLRLRITNTPAFSTLRIRLNSHVLQELQLSSEQTTHHLEVADLMVPAGGHHLFFDLFPGGPTVTISEVSLKSGLGSSDELTSQLPFDLQQRYRLAGEITQVLTPAKVLDVGGYLGDKDGHLAVSADFLGHSESEAIVVTTDVRHCDHPGHLPCRATKQPFPTGSFNLVVSLDVLEHLSDQERSDYLNELDRVSSGWILLGAPFSSSFVEALEASLVDQLDLTFLREHRQYGLPSHRFVEDFFVRKGYLVKAFPNGYLPIWEAMQLLTQLLFSIRDHRVVRELNQLYSRHLYSTDLRRPSYRTVYLISKKPLSQEEVTELDSIPNYSAKPDEDWGDFLLDPAWASIIRSTKPILSNQLKSLNDVQFLANERQRAIRSLKAQNEELLSMPLWRFALKRLRRLKGRLLK